MDDKHSLGKMAKTMGAAWIVVWMVVSGLITLVVSLIINHYGGIYWAWYCLIIPAIWGGVLFIQFVLTFVASVFGLVGGTGLLFGSALSRKNNEHH
jgi:hypothetical protein